MQSGRTARSWYANSNDWLCDRPALNVGLYVLVGMVLVSLQLGPSVVHLAFGGALWGLGGWIFVVRGSHRGDDATA